MSDIRQWLEELGLGQYADAFEENDIDESLLPDLTDEALERLGVASMGHRMKLLKAFAAQSSPDLETAEATEPLTPEPGKPAVEAERRQITVMFCDLVGSTALSEKLDPEDLRKLMQSYQKAAGAVIERYDGHIAQYLGDGLMTYFGWPRAHEDDAQRAVRAGLEIVEAVSSLAAPVELAVRVGISTGLVVVGETGGGDPSVAKTAAGETPNIAARLEQLAEPDAVIIGESTRQLIGGAFDLEDLGARDLKGVSAPIPVYRVMAESAVKTRFEAAHEAGLMSMVGREEEIALLLKRWNQAKNAEGKVVLLSGEPGIGKSHITEALRERVAGEPHIRLRNQCSPYHTNSAFYPMIDQLERAAGFKRDDPPEVKLDKLEAVLAQSADDVPNVASLFAAMLSLPLDRYPPLNLSPQKQKEHLIAALADQVSALARRQPVLIIFEDAHWIDPTSLDVLGAMIDEIPDSAVLLVITYRPEFDPPWAGHSHITTLTLNRLGRREGAEIVAKVTGGKTLPDEVLDQIVAKTDGVPLFVEELTKNVLEGGFLIDEGDHYTLDGPLPSLAIPATLQDSLMARLDRLASVKEVAQIGACIGREFSFELLSAVSPLRDNELQDSLTQLANSELIFRRGTPPHATYTFKHALIQDTAYESLLKTRRQKLHRHIAEALKDGFPDVIETQPEILAQHLTAANLNAPAAEYWRKAGERAADHFAHAEAVNHFTKGLDALSSVTDASDNADRALALLFGLVASLRILGRSKDALGALDQAEALAARDRRTLDLANIHYRRGNVYFPLGEVDNCRKEHEIALTHAREAGSAEFEARALSGLADADYLQGRMITAFANFDRCIEVCRSHGFTDIEVANLPMRGWGRYHQCDVAGGLEDCLAGAEGAARDGNHREEMLARSASCFFLWEMEEFEASRAQTEIASELTQRLGARNF